ncbi:MAG: biotin--[acetyl-CoA-carboxylase] ligase [Pseudomonadota bacterium]
MGAHVESVGSTNLELAKLFHESGRRLDRYWLTSDEQVMGRGRRERNWVSPPGNLYASLCLDVSAVPDRSMAVLPLAIGVAIQKCVASLVANPVLLKWPNDVLIDGAKCCGLLLERHIHPQSGDVGLIVGIGLNVASHPPDTPYPATHLSAHGFAGDLSTVFNHLTMCVAEALANWRSPDFVADVTGQWTEHAKGIGEPVVVRLANETLSGIFDELDAQGRLMLRMANGDKRSITAGDVFFS